MLMLNKSNKTLLINCYICFSSWMCLIKCVTHHFKVSPKNLKLFLLKKKFFCINLSKQIKKIYISAWWPRKKSDSIHTRKNEGSESGRHSQVTAEQMEELRKRKRITLMENEAKKKESDGRKRALVLCIVDVSSSDNFWDLLHHQHNQVLRPELPYFLDYQSHFFRSTFHKIQEQEQQVW